MQDLQIAAEQLNNHGCSLVIVKEGRVIARKEGRGIRPLFETVRELGEDIYGSSLADKVIGRAAAMLCIYAGIQAVYTRMASESAVSVLEDSGIAVRACEIVPAILNRDMSGLCPMEKTIDISSEPRDAVKLIEDFLERIKTDSP